MDYFLHNLARIIIAVVIFAGCSKSPEPYKLDATQESAGSSFRSGTIVEDGVMKTVFSAIYLNDIYPQYPHKQAQFLIAIYSKSPSKVYFYTRPPKSEKNSYYLSSKNSFALSSKKLDEDDLLIELMPIHYKWATYYYVTYPLSSSIASITLHSNNDKQVILNFKDIYKEPKAATFGI